MPGGDRTGPVGMGPMTGRGAGLCGGYPAPGFTNAGWGTGGGRGWGRGFGRGIGRGFGGGGVGWRRAWNYAPAPAEEQELNALRNQASYFEQTLEELRSRIGQLESSSKDKEPKQ